MEDVVQLVMVCTTSDLRALCGAQSLLLLPPSPDCKPKWWERNSFVTWFPALGSASVLSF